MLLGVGMDCDDGEVRVTNADNFVLLGGSHDTHECMQDRCIKFNELLDSRGKRIEDLERQELIDVAAECEMPLVSPNQKRR
jgi:hypothetical protein